MGSEQFEALNKIGIERGGGGEACHGDPRSFTIIGLDIEAEKLLGLYSETEGRIGEAHRRAVAIIKGVRDRTRTKEPPPAEFIASLGDGVVESIIVANLGADRKGKTWVVVVAGRQRTWGLRLWNEKATAANRRELPAELRGFRNRSGIDAELTAIETNASSNVFVAMRPSQQADHACMLRDKGISEANIAIRIGAKDADHVRLLLALAACVPEVQDAVDAMRIPMTACPSLAKLPAEEQARRVLRKTAGNGRAAQDKAAPPRPKTRPARELARLEHEARQAAKSHDTVGVDARMVGFAEGLAFSQGKDPPSWAKKLLAKTEEVGG